MSLAELKANPKDLYSLVNIPFPRSLRSVQSFLGSLNYYSQFIKDVFVNASVLYGLREADFHEIHRAYDDPKTVEVAGRTRLCHTAHKSNQKLHPIAEGDQESHPIAVVIRNRTQLPRAIRIRKAGVAGRKEQSRSPF